MLNAFRLPPTLVALLGAATFAAHGAEPCLDNFSAEGSFFSGKVYKSFASVANVSAADAFARVARFTAENGFTIATADKQLGLISASQSVSAGQGKTVPLSVSVQEESGSTRIAMTYATSAGVMSPEDAIKRHFCMTVAAASAGAAAPGSAPAAPGKAPAAAAPTGAPPAVATRTMRGYAAATPAQQKAIDAELSKAQSNAKLRAPIAEAAPAIRQLVERLACLADYDGASALNEQSAPEASLYLKWRYERPMVNARYHNKAECLTVVRIQGWSAPALNALQFEVVYRADDSGEAAKTAHEAVRQSDGVWLFTR